MNERNPFLFIVLCVLLLSSLVNACHPLTGETDPNNTAGHKPDPTSTPLPPSPSLTTITTKIHTPTPQWGLGSTHVSEVDGMIMVYIPTGAFRMGSEDGKSDELPVHDVYLDAFWIDEHQVTLEQYQFFMFDTGYIAQPCGDGYDYPVGCVDWSDSQAYCNWAGRRLPTEAEWEKAARGGLEGKRFPWGNEDPVCEAGAKNGAQFSDCNGRPISVKTFSPNSYMVYDMTGNVWEWVADWYDSDYYSSSPYENPTGPESGDSHVLRGGSSVDDYFNLRSSNRDNFHIGFGEDFIGFRCAASE